MEKLLGERLYGEIIDPKKVTELRIRTQRPVEIKTFSETYYLSFIPNEEYINEILQRAMNHSQYAYEDELSAGYIHYRGGIRIGIAGRGKVRTETKISFSSVTSLCIRIPHEICGVSNKLGDFYSEYKNTLIVSPPFCGKTTLIRDMGKVLSDIYETLYIDERGELCASGMLKTGKKADVIQGIPKKYVYENIIRAMAPEIVICDELLTENDFTAIDCLARSGIKCLASFHADGPDEIPLSLKKNFEIFVFLSKNPTIGTIKRIRKND